MIKSVNNYAISELFNISNKVVYCIPRYQREYTWNKSDWENLFDDILENPIGYFLGSIICINQSKDALGIQSLEVVDGQQRLTTLSILFSAMYKVLLQYSDELEIEQTVELVNLKHKLVLKGEKDKIRVIPQVQNNNQGDYLGILSELKVTNNSFPLPRNAGNRKIVRAYRYFQDRIQKMSAESSHAISSLINFLEKLTQSCLVKIEVESHADAYILFESLNNRGVPLTAIDLIKNKLLTQLEQVESGNIDSHFNSWNILLGYLGDDYSVQERFFRQYYNAFKNKLKEIYNVPVATRSNLIQIYQELINHNPQNFLRDILLAGEHYKAILQLDLDTELTPFQESLKKLERIQGAPSYLLMLYLLMQKTILGLDEKLLNNVTDFLVCFFVRRNLTDTPPTRDLTRLFMGIIDKLSERTGNEVFDLIKEQLITVSASDDLFKQKLSGSIYEENYGVTRFILCSLEEQNMTYENKKDLWQKKGNKYLWTIEHILPQGTHLPDDWIKMIAEGDSEKAAEYQANYVHRLGNLTISAYNSNLGNKTFQQKRDRVDSKGNPIGYNNGLILNKDLVKEETWSIEKIEKRTDSLVNQILELFSLDNRSF